ncbi:DNA-binding transcriptional regulator, LysR family [Franzmannia pantelleriensis]|uniref:DNA-binding transcriptional regulator, LysR family n=1 Tax=Franzmannia pantelleriensis TaxID=48727 RepID=A0A1G9UA03_9GAMM|nr:LysR family transcriptional regulator [Halomonas pantelleriensis]SDM56728.1 DNA-binding transcriptional regulator, LysR family [Halomonas pantelleriensis]
MHDLDELTAFDAVMQSGNLTRSATRLGLSKSTLSRRISQLEARLGYPLLRRQSNRLLPTEAGALFHGYCLRMLELAQQSQAALEALHHEISGELVIDVHAALARPWMTQVLHAFMERHRRVDVTLKTHERFHASADSSAIHVTLGAVIDETLRCEQLTLLHRGIYAHPDYLARHGRPQQPDELLDHHWIDLLGDAAGGLLLRQDNGAQFLFQPPRSRLRLDQPMLQADAIARGQGLGIMPCWLAERRERAHPGELEACLPDWQLPTLPVNLLYAHGHQAGKVSAMLTFLRRHLPPEWRANADSTFSVAS